MSHQGLTIIQDLMFKCSQVQPKLHQHLTLNIIKDMKKIRKCKVIKVSNLRKVLIIIHNSNTLKTTITKIIICNSTKITSINLKISNLHIINPTNNKAVNKEGTINLMAITIMQLLPLSKLVLLQSLMIGPIS